MWGMEVEKCGKNCSICGVSATKTCSNCSKIYYCSVEHQREDWKRHKKDCKPKPLTNEVWSETLGNYLVASRDIKPGERILTDYPLLVGPTGSLPKFAKLCLNCSKLVTTKYKCSTCSWPMCGISCEKGSNHSEYECSIFKANGILPKAFSDSLNIYGDIHLLRALLLREKDDAKWKKLMSLESHVEERKSEECFVSKANQQFSFIKDTCKLEDFDFETVNYISGVMTINTFEPRCVNMLPVPADFQCEARIYSNLSKISHECVSNVKVLEYETEKKNGGVILVATTPIQKGEPLIQFYGSPEHGTLQRQRMQKLAYFFQCKCRRCIDPTELGTYYSAIKCTNKNCLDGYLLPTDPTCPESLWKCTEEHCEEFMTCKDVEELIRKIVTDVQKIQTDYDKKKEYFRQNPPKNLEFLDLMEVKLKTLSSETVHPNHFTTFPLKDNILELLKNTDKPFGESEFGLWVGNKMEKYAQQCLAVYDIFFPGLTPERGKYMFFVAVAKSSLINAKAHLHPGRAVLLEETRKCNEIEKLALEMLAGMPEGSEAKNMSLMLQYACFATQKMIAALLRA